MNLRQHLVTRLGSSCYGYERLKTPCLPQICQVCSTYWFLKFCFLFTRPHNTPPPRSAIYIERHQHPLNYFHKYGFSPFEFLLSQFCYLFPPLSRPKKCEHIKLSFGPFSLLRSIWSISVQFNLLQSTLVKFNPFGPLRSIRSILVHFSLFQFNC